MRADLESHRFLLSELYQASIRVAATGPYLEILDPAAEALPIEGRGRLNIVLGAMLGLLLGVGTVFTLEYFHPSLRWADRGWPIGD